MATVPLSNARADGEDIEIVGKFVYFGSMTNDDSSSANVIATGRRISIYKSAVKKLRSGGSLKSTCWPLGPQLPSHTRLSTYLSLH